MKDSKALLLKYLRSIGDPDRAAALFAEDGALELPFLRSLGVGPRYAGRREIAACLHQLRKLYPDVAFAPDDILQLPVRPSLCASNSKRADEKLQRSEWNHQNPATSLKVCHSDCFFGPVVIEI
jgi:hypothetical protein